MERPQPGSALVLRAISLLFVQSAALLLVVTAAFSAQQSATSAVPQEYDLREYQAQLDRCAKALKDPNELHSLRGSLEPTWFVRVGNARVEASTEPITHELRELEVRPQDSAKIIRDLHVRLAVMRAAAVALETLETRENPEAARARLGTILARREFQGAKGPSAMELFQARISRWIGEKLARLFMRLHISAKTGNALAWGVIILAFLSLCYMVWRWLSGKPPMTQSEPAPKAAPSDARQWVAEALAAAERGDFREAIHCAYWAAVAKLEDMNVLPRDRARTPRESLRLLEHHPNEERMLRGLTTHFELIWYGYRPVSRNDWSRVKEELEKMGCLRASTAPTANS
jgi:uncharacterized protein DUF4129